MKLLQSAFIGVLLACQSPAAIALVDYANASASTGSTATTSAKNTTGATLLIVISVDYNQSSCTDTIVDSKSNTYTSIANHGATNTSNVCIWYAANPTVGSGHTASCTGSYCTIFFSAWSGAATVSPYDTPNECGNDVSSAASVPACSSGNVTPSANNYLVITGLSCSAVSVDASINGGFTLQDKTFTGGFEAGGWAYLVQTTAAAANPTWSLNVSSNVGTAMAAFKVASGGGGSKRRGMVF